MGKKYIYIIILIVFLILIDQVTKTYAVITLQDRNVEFIQNVISFSYVENTGGAFGVGYNNTATFIITNIIVLGIILRFMIVQKERIDKLTCSLLSIILAGGFSNLIDRIVRGYVVDFIEILPKFNLPNINFADIYIVLGWIILACILAINTFKTVKEVKRVEE